MKRKKNEIKIHPTALISESAKIGKGTVVWAFVQVMDKAVIGENCVLGNGVYIDRNVKVGNNVKIHNKALLYNGTIVEDDVFIGPGVCFTNDKYPRNDTTRDLKGVSWRIKKGASIGANATILPDVNIGEGAVVGAGSVVTKDVPPGVTVCGNPAKVVGKGVKSQRVRETEVRRPWDVRSLRSLGRGMWDVVGLPVCRLAGSIVKSQRRESGERSKKLEARGKKQRFKEFRRTKEQSKSRKSKGQAVPKHI